ncbi:hypothetical protein CYMTET_38115 [Cymbomonas tetramitiformis]|uniref:Uncharacterized protein n=1 Tax=Cymbomonas tetramitiformis TaxID=36881 RepID=A0AAE0CEV0_9CHLO|nr:hypothetical protein CYMTET_38115 [Cymbomonas tetramitiformis]
MTSDAWSRNASSGPTLGQPHENGQEDPDLVYTNNHPELLNPTPPWDRPPRHRVPRRPMRDRMRDLARHVASPAESHPLDDSGEDGAAALADENEKWVDAWVPEGWRRYRRRWKRWHGPVAVTLAVTSSDSVLLAVDTECGTIPGSGGDVPGIPDAWCSLFRVHQWNQREREAAEDTYSFATPTPEPAELVTSPSSSPNEDQVSEQLEEDEEVPSDTDSDSERLNFTQQPWEERLQALNARQARQRLSPTGERSSPTALTSIREGVESATLSTITEDPRLEQVLEIRARRSRHLHAIVEEDEIVDIVTTANLQEESPPDHTSTGSPSQASVNTTANPQETILPDPTSTVSTNAPSVPGSKSKLDDACGKNSAWKAGGISVQHENLPWNPPGLPRDCRDSKPEGKYRYITRSEQPSAHTSDEMDRWCGIPRDNWQPSGTRKVAYGKLTAETSVGTYSEVIKMRVLPLGIKVDIVLGGRWLRGLSPVTLDYAGWGTVGFQHKGASVKIAGCSPGRSASRKEVGTAMCLEPIVMLSAAQAVREIKAYRRRHGYRKEGEPGPPHDILIAYATPLVGSSMLSAVAESGEEPDPEVTTAERQKFEKLMGTFEERVVREALPNFDQIRKTEVAHIRMQAGWDDDYGF